MDHNPSIHFVDYGVAILVLAIPLGIGILFAVKDTSNTTRLQYLLAGQRMSFLPVAMSTFVTFQSAIALIGIPSEIYFFGTGFLYFYIGIALCYVLCYYTVVPLLYPLEVTSVYEYLQRRYQSKVVRLLCTAIACLQSTFYMSLVLLSPALALQAVGGMPMWISILVVGGIGTVYTVIGGIKSVIWTDVFQTVIIFIGVFAIIIKASMAVGSFADAWNIANDGGRLVFNNFSPDPRDRMTVFSGLIGGIAMWMSTAFNQATLQRIRSLKSLRDAKIAFLLNVPLTVCFGVVLVITGLVTYAYFSYNKCDPLKAGLIRNPNQVVPYFVLHALNDVPGMTGLYVATLFSGSLSSLSSGINSLAANTVEDILERPLKNVKERTATIVTKAIAALYGLLISCIAYGAQYLQGPVVQINISVHSAFGTPILGMFLLGCLVPWATKYGAIAGALATLVFNVWINIGHQFHGQRSNPLPPADTILCFNGNTTLLTDKKIGLGNSSAFDTKFLTKNSTIHEDGSADNFSLYNVSFEWHAVYGVLICMIVGVVVSFCTRRSDWTISQSNSRLVFPFCRRFYHR